jgi:hypothetical protein
MGFRLANIAGRVVLVSMDQVDDLSSVADGDRPKKETA